MPNNRSTLTYAQAQTEVAGSAGSTDTEMLARAGNSLDATAQKWNRMRWFWLHAEQAIPIIAPFSVSGCTTTVDSATITTSVPSGFTSVLVDDMLAGGGVRPESLISATGATALTLSVAASATVTGTVLTFQRPMYALATNFKSIFDVRLLGSPQPLRYSPRREYDSYIIDHTSAGSVVEYDLYLAGDRGKIRFLPPPAGANTVLLKYYRRIAMPSTTASAGLDLPEDYEDIFIAAAKAHFLVDKGQPHRDQWAFWNQYATEGIKEMRRDERQIEDENLTLQPHLPQRIYNPNSPYYPGNS